MKPPRRHHYVPIVYQNRFVNERGTLWVYDRKESIYDERHPRRICFEKDLYTVKRKGRPMDQTLESAVLAQVDGDFATAVRSLLMPFAGMPNYWVLNYVSHFVGLQHSRLPIMRDFVRRQWELGEMERLRLIVSKPERLRPYVDRYERETGKKLAISAAQMSAAIRRGGVKAVVDEIPFLRNIFSLANNIAGTTIRASWQILRAPEMSGFILCDAPVTVVPPKSGQNVGFHVPGAATYVPLSRGACLRLVRDEINRRVRYTEVDADVVRLINQNVASNSERFIMSPDRTQLEQVVQLSGTAKPFPLPRITFHRSFESDSESFDTIAVNPRGYFYRANGRLP